MAKEKEVSKKVSRSRKSPTKKKSAVKTVKTIKSSGNIELLLKQHVGSPCVPCVKKGDRVLVGTLVARPQGLGANIHSSVDGIVEKVTETSVFIKPKKSLAINGQKIEVSLSKKKENMLERVNEAGVVGMGGAGFPTATKLSTDLNGGYIIVNASECEPLLAHNMDQIIKYPNETIKGIKLAMKIANAHKAIIAIKNKNQNQVEVLLDALKGTKNIHIHLLPDIYPIGEERAIVRECLGKLLPVTSLPSDANATVINVETVLRIYEAVELGRPVISKNLTVVGKLKRGKEAQVFFNVPIGMKVKDVLALAGGVDGKCGEIIMGGAFTGHTCSINDPISKTTNAIIVTKTFKNCNSAKTGLVVCACGGDEDRLKDIAKKQKMKIVDIEYCSYAQDPKGNGVFKCENPGNCPGLDIQCMNIKNAGATEILTSTCSDCTDAITKLANKLNLNLHHMIDHVFETVEMDKMRNLTELKYVDGKIPRACTASRKNDLLELGLDDADTYVEGDESMYVSLEYVKEHINEPAVLRCRREAGTKLSFRDFEDPAIFDDLVSSGLLKLDGAVTIAQAIGKNLTQTLDSLSPITADDIDKLQIQDEVENIPNIDIETKAKPVTKNVVSTAERKHFDITEVKRGSETKIDGTTLYIRKGIEREAIEPEDKILDFKIDIITKKDYHIYSGTIMDVQRISTKEAVSKFGEAATRVLDNVVMMLTNAVEEGVQLGDIEPDDGYLDDIIKWDEPTYPDKGDIIIRGVVSAGKYSGNDREFIIAAHKAFERVAQEIRFALKEVEEE